MEFSPYYPCLFYLQRSREKEYLFSLYLSEDIPSDTLFTVNIIIGDDI